MSRPRLVRQKYKEDLFFTPSFLFKKIIGFLGTDRLTCTTWETPSVGSITLLLLQIAILILNLGQLRIGFDNKMALNIGKTKYKIFRSRGKPFNENDCQLVYNSTEIVSPIERVHNAGHEKNFKLLGVYFDEYLSFDVHTSQLCKKVSKSLFGINKKKNS
jgi:hypothetical protein